MTDQDTINEFFDVVYSHATSRLSGMKHANRKVAHYTSAANAINIISGRTLWLRNAAVMNDFMEISFGKECLLSAIRTRGTSLNAVLNTAHPDLFSEIVKWLDQVDVYARTQTYLTSFAEIDADEELGKLSMWRAYGGPVAGVALVFNLDPFVKDHLERSTSALPVIYGAANFDPEFEALIGRLRTSQALLAVVPRTNAKAILFHAIQDLVLSSKHEGFSEEEEWRAIYSPEILPSEHLKASVETIGGVPQIVHTIPLHDIPGLNMPELELDNLIHRVLIGPCDHPTQVEHAICRALSERGVRDPAARIRISGIPLRQYG
jgi:hypothetical protein